MKISPPIVYVTAILVFIGLTLSNTLSFAGSVVGLVTIVIFALLYLGMYDMFLRPPLRSLRFRISHLFNTNNKLEQYVFKTLNASNCSCQFFQVGEDRIEWNPSVITLYPAYFTCTTDLLTKTETFAFNPKNVQWIGRIHPFDNVTNEIWLDINNEGVWYVLGIRMHKSDMKVFEASFEKLLPDPILKKQNRQHPNIRYGPITAHLLAHVGQRWVIDESDLLLYLTPMYLVIYINGYVAQVIHNSQIENMKVISANIVDGRNTDILYFDAHNTSYAYALAKQTVFSEVEFTDRFRQLLSKLKRSLA